MGQAKKEWMELCERGYALLSDQFVCIKCIKENFLRSLHKEHSEEGECVYCGKTDVAVANAGIIQTQIMESLMADYEDIQDAGAPYETAEGGWQIVHESAQDIVSNNISIIVEEEFGEAIVNAVDIWTHWCERDWTILSPIARMQHGWKEFCHIVKNQLRFSFAFVEADEDPSHPDYTHPTLTLVEIGRLVEKLKLIRKLKPGTVIHRVRIDENDRFTEFDDLGSPPSERAAANRMSPAGIPMFYAAGDIETAIRETWDGESRGVASIATFRTKRPVRIIDFTNLPEPPSYWSNPGRHVLAQYQFLHELAEDLSKPVIRGSRVDLDYAPTQIVSEYLTKAWRGLPRSWNPPPDLVHGLSFRSSKTGRKNYGLNFLKDENPHYGLSQRDFLHLDHVDHHELVP